MYKIDLHILTSDIQTGKHINQLGSFEKEGKALDSQHSQFQLFL